MPAPNRKLIPLARSLAVSLKPSEVAELTRMAAADGCSRVSKWLVKQIREKIIQTMPLTMEEVAARNPPNRKMREVMGIPEPVESGVSNGLPGDPVAGVSELRRHETKASQAEPIEQGAVGGTLTTPVTEARQDPPPAPVAPHSPPLNRSWASLGLDERKAKAAEWGVKPPEGWGAWTPEARTKWLDETYPLSPLADTEEVGW